MFTKVGLATATAVVVAFTGACAGSETEAEGQNTAGAGGTTSAAADCPLVSASDPGNSKAPADTPMSTDAPKVTKKDSYNVAFSQITSDNPFRSAETASMKAEAEARGWKITVTDAGGKEDKQIAGHQDLISQKPDAIFLAPITEQLAPW
jgi:ABC-type sugar transport system substrate-binding protein